MLEASVLPVENLPSGPEIELAGLENWKADRGERRLGGSRGGLLGKLDNGVGYAILPMENRTSVVIAVAVGAGSRHETQDEVGVAHLVEHLLFKGLQRWRLLEGVGGGAEGETDKEVTLFTFRVPAGELRLGLEVAQETLERGHFGENEVEKEKNVVVDEIRMLQDSTLTAAYLAFDRAMWPNSPLGRLTGGSSEEVMALTAQQCANFYRRAYTGANLRVVVAGAVGLNEGRSLVDRYFGGLAEGRTLKLPEPSFGAGHQVVSVTRATAQAVAVGAEAGEQVVKVLRGGEEAVAVVGGEVGGYTRGWRPAAQLLAVILGRGMASCWYQKLREQSAIVYDVHSLLVQHRETGFLAGVASCDPKRLNEVIEQLEEPIYRIASIGLSDHELKLAKAYQKGQFLMGQDDTAAMAVRAAVQLSLEGFMLSHDEELAGWEAVTEEEIQAVAAGMVGRGLRMALAGAVDR